MYVGNAERLAAASSVRVELGKGGKSTLGSELVSVLKGVAKLDLGVERIHVRGERPWDREPGGEEGYDPESQVARELKVGIEVQDVVEETPRKSKLKMLREIKVGVEGLELGEETP